MRSNRDTHRNEQVGNLSLVLGPGLTILVAAALNVTQSTVGDHAGKEERVEPWERAGEASNQPPVQGEEKITGIVNLAGLAVPAIHKNLPTIGSGESLGVLNSLPRKLGESVTLNHGATFLLAEAVLLAVGGVPNPVDKKIRDVQESQEVPVPMVLGGIVVGQVNGAVAVTQGDTGQVPEDKHETPLLVVHIPGLLLAKSSIESVGKDRSPSGHNALLALGASVGVEEVSHDQKHDLTRNIAVDFPLTGSRTHRKEKQNIPRQTDLEEHLEVQDAEHTGVQLSTHEEIIDGRAGHTVLQIGRAHV